jgi:hypothetical protein
MDYNDGLQVAALEILCEMAVRCPRVLAWASGFHVWRLFPARFPIPPHSAHLRIRQVIATAALDCLSATYSKRNLVRVPRQRLLPWQAHNHMHTLLAPYPITGTRSC